MPFKQQDRMLFPAPERSRLHSNTKNLTGRRFEELTVQGDSGFRTNHREVLWDCTCSCGQEDVLRTGSTLQAGRSISCGHTRSSREARINQSIGQRIVNAAIKRAFQSYRGAAISRGIDFELSENEFCEIVVRRCDYCDSLPTMIKKTKFDSVVINGIDRVDNTEGYVVGNCVACCTVCNLMKRTMDRQKFLEHVDRISLNCKKEERNVA